MPNEINRSAMSLSVPVRFFLPQLPFFFAIIQCQFLDQKSICSLKKPKINNKETYRKPLAITSRLHYFLLMNLPWLSSSGLLVLFAFLGLGFGLELKPEYYHVQNPGNMTMPECKINDFEQGWEFMEKGITKLKNILEGLPEPLFSPEDYMMLYTTIYNMCRQKPPHDYSQQLYDKYRESIEEYITSKVLPSLREKHGEFMVRELVKRWSNHKIMLRWLTRFFHYLERYFIAERSLPGLNEVGLTCFRDLVYKEINGKVRDAVISLIDQEREGEQVDRALLKDVVDIFVEIGMGQMDCYENDFEAVMLKDTAAYYSRKASNWILDDSYPDYMLKAEECLKQEKDRVSHYLHSSSEQKLLEVCDVELKQYQDRRKAQQ